MKAIFVILSLSALCLSFTYAGQACIEGCFKNICITPYGSNNAAKQQCSANLDVNMRCVNESCSKDGFSDSCIKKRCTSDRAFLDFTHCYADCNSLITTGIKYIQKRTQQLEGKMNKVHDLTKKNNINGQTQPANPTPTPQPAEPTPTPTPKPAEPQPAAEPVVEKTFSQVIAFAFAALSLVFVF